MDGYAYMLCDNESIYKNSITPYSVLNKEYNFIAYHRFREVVSYKTIRVYNQVTENNLSDIFTNIIISSRGKFLL